MINKYNDNELLYLISENDEIAFKLLCEKYHPLIVSRLKRFKISQNFEDYYQECLITLYKCVISYREDKSITFNKYLDMRIQFCIRNLLRLEHNYFYRVVLVDYDELDYTNHQSNTYGELKEEYAYRDSSLSVYEKKVLGYMNNGYKVREIADALDKNLRSVYNAIKRIKHKNSHVIENKINAYEKYTYLSELENIINCDYLNGLKPKDISKRHNFDISVVYNTLKRIKFKNNKFGYNKLNVNKKSN